MGGVGGRVMDGMDGREENSPDGEARAGVTRCCWMADEALRVVIWNLETVGTPGSVPYQAVAAVLGRSDAAGVAIKGERQGGNWPTRASNAAPL